MKYLGTVGMMIVLILIGLVIIFQQSATEVQSPANQALETSDTIESMNKNAPEMQIDPQKTYQAVLKTDLGDITIEFDTQNTPITSNNFISLARDGFYDGTIFHRTIENFMIQGGDPQGNGTGDPGYRFDDEYLEGEYVRGTVAMANSGPDTNGSQFFIIHKDYPLPNSYVIFGSVVEGMDVVDQIATAEVKTSFSGEASVPVNPVAIESIEIIEE